MVEVPSRRSVILLLNVYSLLSYQNLYKTCTLSRTNATVRLPKGCSNKTKTIYIKGIRPTPFCGIPYSPNEVANPASPNQESIFLRGDRHFCWTSKNVLSRCIDCCRRSSLALRSQLSASSSLSPLSPQATLCTNTKRTS